MLQQASVVGRLFWDRVVAHIQAAEGGRPQTVPEALTSLRGREMVYRREASAFIDAREYLFKHDILREVTYESVLKRLRRRYHGLVADWLIAQVGARAGEHSGLIAGHLLLAGRKEQAGQYFIRAGEAALASFSTGEAEAHFLKALDLSTEGRSRAACLAWGRHSGGKLAKKKPNSPCTRRSISTTRWVRMTRLPIFMRAYPRRCGLGTIKKHGMPARKV